MTRKRDGGTDVEPCTWKYDGWDNAYATNCGQTFLLIEGSLSDNAFHFCAFCGHPIKEEENEDDPQT